MPASVMIETQRARQEYRVKAKPSGCWNILISNEK